MARTKKACPCSRQIEDMADALEILGDMHDVLVDMFERRCDVLEKMEQHRRAAGADVFDADHPLIQSIGIAHQELHALQVLTRMSGMARGIPDLGPGDAATSHAAFHGDDVPGHLAVSPFHAKKTEPTKH